MVERYLLLGLLLLMPDYSFANSQSLIKAKIIKNQSSSKEVFTSKGGMEGWANVSFVIDKKGRTKDIVVFDNSGKDRYTTKTITYIKNLRFSPALLNDTPVKSSKNMFVAHTYSGAGHSEGSVTPAFAKGYQAIMDSIATQTANMADIKVLIDKLVEDHTKNLNEHALAAWLKSIYYYKNQNFLEYTRQSQITLELANYLPVSILAKSTVNLFESQLHFGYFLAADETLFRMGNIEGLNFSEETKKQFEDVLRSKIESNIATPIKGQLTPLGAWSYYHQLPKFKIELTQGNIETAELRCANYQQKFINNWQQTIAVPPQASGCILLIQGEKGTTFDIVGATT